MSTFATLATCLYGMSPLQTIVGAQKVAADDTFELAVRKIIDSRHSLAYPKLKKVDSFPYLQG